MKIKSNELKQNLRIDLQIIIDGLKISPENLSYHRGVGIPSLIGPRLYQSDTSFHRQYVYLALEEELPSSPPDEHGSLIIIGKAPKSYSKSRCHYVEIHEKANIYSLFQQVQQIFEEIYRWKDQLQYALNHDLGIGELCRISLDFFRNPLFIHDAQFNILACPLHVPNMPVWAFNERTGMETAPLELVNDFKTDPEYQRTLATHGANMYSASLRGHRVLYVNIWGDDNHYQGRLCIDELQTALLPGQFTLAEYFVSVIKIAMMRRNYGIQSFNRPYEQFFEDVLSHTITDTISLQRGLDASGWKMDDSYLCIRLVNDQRKIGYLSIISTCNYIEGKLSDTVAFPYKDGIAILIRNADQQDYMPQISYIIREGLLKAGVSNMFHDFKDAYYYYRQAELALEYGSNKNPTIWCHHFLDYILDYMLSRGTTELPAHVLCPEGLMYLKVYDLENDTQLYQTLQVFLDNERHATKTAKDLFIHRSTLFYRLDRILEILNLDLENQKSRLYLQMCFHLLED